MKTKIFEKLLTAGAGAITGLAAAGCAFADAGALEPLGPWRWLFVLPDTLAGVLLVVLFSGLAWLGLALYRRRTGRGQGAGHYAALAGGLLGLVVAVFAAGPWKAYLSDYIAGLPPTAVGTPAPWSPQLLESADRGDVTGASREPEKAIAGRARHAKVNVAALGAARLNLNLFDDTQLTAVRDRVDLHLAGGMAWVGHIEGVPNSEVVLAAKGAVIMGTVDLVDRFFEIAYLSGNTHAVRELAPNSTPMQFEPGNIGLAVKPATTAGSTGQVVDLMMLYTPMARVNAGGFTGVETRIMNAVTRANQAFLNSQVAIHLNLVYMGEVNYTEAGDMAVALKELQGTADGYMDEVHMLRNLYAADLVTLVDADSNYCGIANTLPALSAAYDAAVAFAVVHDDSVYNCLGSNNTLAHAVGHALGNSHNPESRGSSGIFTDSQGYGICGAFRDVMSERCTTEPRIPYFSNPNVFYNGQPTGVFGTNDTARSMTLAAPTVADFRTSSSVTSVPASPDTLTAVAGTADSILLDWTDNDDDETGYTLQRSVDASHWLEVAALGPNAVNFVDTGLRFGQTYYYRVYAYNSIGYSAFSNEAVATPSTAQADTTAPVVIFANPLSGAGVSGMVKVSVSASDDTGVSGLKLYIDSRLVGATSSGALTYNWNTNSATAGSHEIAVQAIDSAGNIGRAIQSVTTR
ncbi:Ig-like domain-containing protein [uncultured Thiodictyon sp.]|nr:Ig-like domain-containing protein [uncultured Thiodictyon sp.]